MDDENEKIEGSPDEEKGSKVNLEDGFVEKQSKSKGKENRGVSMGLKWAKGDEFLSDLCIFSSKNQEKLMKKAMEKQEKINREAEKIVKWAKQASARMDVSSIEEELSDDDTFN
ncbi:hypothetical protein KY290_000848 [Solanum tuberosum]|uniref:Uncharacterized protein n=1 Tax=Solanum tuberosum TaxID=4113 RepID=A0ABQ7WL30_SOLTU|nr:hypothetical protein KY289_000906 [Solanum tuberosum]KAH0781250.1 hypothetical protein KY290_000848 [Solanum tuberosum]